MFRLVKISFITSSSLTTIVGFLLVFLSVIILYLNVPTTQLFNVLEDLCKTKSNQFGGIDISTTFTYVTIQAVLSLPVGSFVILASIFSIIGAGNLNTRFLKIALYFWVASISFLSLFLVYSAASTISVNNTYMYCYLSVLTDLLQRGAGESDEVRALFEKTEVFLDCCGVRGPADYNFYSELFGKDRYPRSCCYDRKLDLYNCKEEHILKKLGCYHGIQNGLKNRKILFTFTIVFITLFLCPLILQLLWIIRAISRHTHVDEDDFENSSEEHTESTDSIKQQ